MGSTADIVAALQLNIDCLEKQRTVLVHEFRDLHQDDKEARPFERDIVVQRLWNNAKHSREQFLQDLVQEEKNVSEELQHLRSALVQVIMTVGEHAQTRDDEGPMNGNQQMEPETLAKKNKRTAETAGFSEDEDWNNTNDGEDEVPVSGKRRRGGALLRIRTREDADSTGDYGKIERTKLRPPQLVRRGSRTVVVRRQSEQSGRPIPRLTRSRSKADGSSEFFMLE
ncbi:hypothetical protein BGX28_008053 [Mortierella sp. GBA30]|nr:hypothetical protein BGX28_008053 [Mortierella sp. GBA30]